MRGISCEVAGFHCKTEAVAVVRGISDKEWSLCKDHAMILIEECNWTLVRMVE